MRSSLRTSQCCKFTSSQTTAFLNLRAQSTQNSEQQPSNQQAWWQLSDASLRQQRRYSIKNVHTTVLNIIAYRFPPDLEPLVPFIR